MKVMYVIDKLYEAIVVVVVATWLYFMAFVVWHCDSMAMLWLNFIILVIWPHNPTAKESLIK